MGHFLVASNDEVVFARVIGLGTMNNTVSLKQFLDGQRERGFRKFVFDLSKCDGFDSTFMGILLGIALREASVILVNLKNPQRKLLTDVGIHRVVKVCKSSVSFPDVSMQKLESQRVETRTRLQNMIEAHDNLVQVDPRNQAKFGAFLETLRQELGEGSPL